jgi:hypothetical protein
MIPVLHESIPHQMTSLTWPEASVQDLVDLLGEENVSVIPGGGVQVRNGDGEWFTLGDKWGTGIDSDGFRSIMTPGILAKRYRKVNQ